MFERFTAKARHAIVLAQEEARRMNHNYIGTEHVLLGLVHESEGVAARVLAPFGLTLDTAREEVAAIAGTGKKPPPSTHIPFTPRAKKSLELALREALGLHHNYIGTEHLLLGLMREDEGVAAQVMRQHADLLKIRVAVLDLVPAGTASPVRARNWLRRVADVMGAGGGPAGDDDEPGEPERQSVLSATPAADHTLSTATRLAGDSPVGSHHLLLAALTDANSAAAKILASLGVDLNQAKDALRDADVTGTSDEQPEEAGRRQMNIQVTGEMMMVVVTDETLVKSAAAALQALGKDKAPGATIRGADLQGAPAANLAKAWQSLHDALLAITTRAESESAPGAGDEGSAEDASSAGGVADPGAGEGGTGSPAA